jgi:dimethylargininase
LARNQHKKYCDTLKELGLEVIWAPRDNQLPDSCFVEDNAIVHGKKALICRMAKESRRDETQSIASILKEYLAIKWAIAPATIEGGDVVHLTDRLICGVSKRTNVEGVSQLSNWLQVHIDIIEDTEIMHLKSYLTYLGKNRLISTRKYAKHSVLENFEVLVVPESEEYAADTLTIGDTVLMAKSYPLSHNLVREAGYEVIPMDISEIEKCDGALTCLSILF